MSAPLSPTAAAPREKGRAKARPTTSRGSRDTHSRAVAHRFAGACARSLDDVIAIGVRFDDDDAGYGETLVVRLRPGRMEALGSIRGPSQAVALLGGDPVVLDAGGALRNLAGDALLGGVADIHGDVQHASGAAQPRLLALCGDDIVDVENRVTVARVAGALSVRGGVVRTADGVVDLDGNVRVVGAVDAAAVDAAGTLAFARGKTLTVGATSMALPFAAHVLCHVALPAADRGAPGARGRWFVGGRSGGLAVVEEDVVCVLRPSLRAHTLAAVPGLPGHAGGLLVVSDLFVATSDDGVDFISRDLASYVRLAEKHAG